MDLVGTLLSLVSGGGLGFLARGAMQVVGFFQQRQADKQTLAMRELDINHEKWLAESSRETAKLISAGKLAAIEATGDANVAAEEARAFTVAMQDQAKPTGIGWIDAANGFMRPFGYYSILAVYFGWKASYLFSAIGPQFTLMDSLQIGWTDLDSALLGSAWGFVWADRSFSKNTVAAKSVR